MKRDEQTTGTGNMTRGAFWASAVFYGLIALEFFYMFSPFAAYVYSVYGPGLGALSLTGSTSWLIGFFMPHIVRETQSLLITWHEAIGGVLLTVGLIGFAVGAAQVYWSKLTGKEVVVGGVYRWIRHPQYLALMMASFGMVLIWPRYLVVVGFVTLCFAYVLLARMEERICSRKFPTYDDYRATTGMFLPRRFERLSHRLPWPSNGYGQAAAALGLYAVLLGLAFAGARAMHIHAVDSLYAHSTDTEVYLSLGRFDPDSIAALADIARSDPDVNARLDRYADADHRFVNYVMPTELLVSEVPMYIPEGRVPSHQSPHRQDQRRYKVIFTRAHFGPGGPAEGRAILRRAVHKSPIVEAWIDRTSRRVERVLDPPAKDIYDGMPVPVF